MRRADLEGVAVQMVAAGKGILAADESSGTIKKRFDKIGLESTEESRRAYRDLLLSTPDMAKSISGVIFYDETLRQKTSSGVPFGAYLGQLGVLPGIKVDTGAKPLAAFPNETITEGLDGLRERLLEYYGLGARFAKVRGSPRPSRYTPMPRRWRVTRRCARNKTSCRSSNRKCSWMERTPSSAAKRSPTPCWPRYSSSCTLTASTWKA